MFDEERRPLELRRADSLADSAQRRCDVKVSQLEGSVNALQLVARDLALVEEFAMLCECHDAINDLIAKALATLEGAGAHDDLSG